MISVPFNMPTLVGSEAAMMQDALAQGELCGGGCFTQRCERIFESMFDGARSFLTPSCTHSLEMAALILQLGPDDEVIMPSFTFVSTANAFALRGVRIVFVDIRPDTMNIDETLLERAITPRTKAIVAVHYGGVACEMDTILAIANQHELAVVEDAAQGIMSSYRGRPLGSMSDLGALSFHETKNLTSAGEGGLTIVNDPALVESAEITRDKGTNRRRFIRGELAEYSWVGLGSSYLLNETSAACLWAQLEQREIITRRRMQIYERYRDALAPIAEAQRIDLQRIPEGIQHNAHLLYIKLRDIEDRRRVIDFLGGKGVQAVFHYVPLHSSSVGRVMGRFSGEDRYTTRESERLLRLPIYFNMTDAQQEHVIDALLTYFRRNK